MSDNKLHDARNLLSSVQDDIRCADATLHNLARYVETQPFGEMDRDTLKRLVDQAREPLEKYNSF